MNRKAQKPRTPKPNALTNDQQVKQLWAAIEDLVKDDERLQAKLHALSVDSREHDERLQVVERLNFAAEQANDAIYAAEVVKASEKIREKVKEVTDEIIKHDLHRGKWRFRLEVAGKVAACMLLASTSAAITLMVGNIAGWW